MSPEAELLLRAVAAAPRPSRVVLPSHGARAGPLLALAERHLVLPQLHAALPAIADPLLRAEVAAGLAARLPRVAFHNLACVEVLTRLSRDVLEPAGIDHALVKGPALAVLLGGDLAARQFRDLDLLVDPRRLGWLGEQLCRRGWRLTNPQWQGEPIAVLARYVSALELVGPEGIRVELHRLLDDSGCLFDASGLLRRARTLSLGSARFRTLAVDDHFRYCAMHHARHRFSSLHWASDLQAFAARTDFDRARLLRESSGRLRPSVAAALELADWLDALPSAVPTDGPRFVGQLLAALDGRLLPMDARDPVDLPMAWQQTFGFRACRAAKRTRPSIDDYRALPLPVGWHGLYWLLRPARVAWQRLRRA